MAACQAAHPSLGSHFCLFHTRPRVYKPTRNRIAVWTWSFYRPRAGGHSFAAIRSPDETEVLQARAPLARLSTRSPTLVA
jgi:hypothetical protein